MMVAEASNPYSGATASGTAADRLTPHSLTTSVEAPAAPVASALAAAVAAVAVAAGLHCLTTAMTAGRHWLTTAMTAGCHWLTTTMTTATMIVCPAARLPAVRSFSMCSRSPEPPSKMHEFLLL